MILIIDDDAGVRSSLTFLLKHAGFQAEAVSGPKEAIAHLREQTPELVLMDMNFSMTTTGEEGLQLLRQVKVLYPDLPVILMTAWGSIALAGCALGRVVQPAAGATRKTKPLNRWTAPRWFNASISVTS